MAPPSRKAIRLAVRVFVGVALLVVALVVVSGRREELQGAASLLQDLRWDWLSFAAIAELASVVAFAALQQTLLTAGGLPVRLGPLLGITFAGNSIANSLPGGAAWASAFAFQQYRRRGADVALTTWTLVAVTGLSSATLAVLAVIGFEAAGDEGPFGDLRPFALLVLAVGAGLVVLFRRPRLVASLSERLVRQSQRWWRWPKGDPVELVEGARTSLSAVQPSTLDWSRSAALALGNWLGDCSCLVMSFLAVRAPVPWRGLLLAYGAGQLAANLPLTPGGLGVVEGSLAIALVAYGGGEVSTVAAVLLYRILSFWALLPIGWGSWGLLWFHHRRHPMVRAPAVNA